MNLQTRQSRFTPRNAALFFLFAGPAGALFGWRGFQGTTKQTPPVQTRARIAYEIGPRFGDSPGVTVSLRFDAAPETDSIDVQMPVWSPGDYHVQNFAQYVQNFHAWAGSPDDAHPLAVTRPDANTWRIPSGGARTLTVTYALPVTPPGFFSENIQVANRRVFINGPAALLYIVGRKTDSASVTLDLPQGWQAESPLPVTRSETERQAVFSAPDYDTLADSPLLAAPAADLKTLKFMRNGKPHRAVFFDAANQIANIKDYEPILTSVAQAESEIMGETPYDRYEWFFDVGGRGGGLEHLNSSRIALRPDDTPRRAAVFIAHEFFHLWNVKRIRPRVLGPFDYVHPPRTRNLWFAEGVTEYYARIATRRAGLRTEREFLDHWGEALADCRRNPKFLETSADDSSLNVWEAGNSKGQGVSYYDKGELIGLCLDLKIRYVTKNRRSLDDVMRLLMQRFAPPKPGYDEDAIRAAVSEVAGMDLSDFYDLLARSAKPMPFAECLGYAGLDAEANPLPVVTPEQAARYRDWAKETKR